MGHSMQQTRRSWLRSQRDNMEEILNDEHGSFEGSDQKPWGSKTHGIVKTTDVEVFHSDRTLVNRANDSDEMLVSESVVYKTS